MEERIEQELATLYSKLTAEFGDEAYSVDPSRGVDLIGLKGAYVVDRLNKVFGLVGSGWIFTPGEEDIIDSGGSKDGKKEFTMRVALQYRSEGGSSYPVWWGNGWTHLTEGQQQVWSMPVWGTGSNRLGTGGGTPYGDAKKGAETDAISKAASKLGIGIDAYKGELRSQVSRDGTIHITRVTGAAEEHVEEHVQDMSQALVDVLNVMKKDTDLYDVAMSNHPIVRDHFNTYILAPIATYIEDNDLGSFVKDNFGVLLNDKEIKSFSGMTMAQAAYLASLVHMIVTDDEFTWEDALEVATIDGGNLSWAASVEEWYAGYAATGDEDDKQDTDSG